MAPIALCGLLLTGMAATGIYNSDFDSRELLLFAMLGCGLVLFTWSLTACMRKAPA